MRSSRACCSGRASATRSWAPIDFGYDPEQKPYAYDPKKSRQLLAEAGFPRGFETPCYNFTTQREPNLKEVGEAIFAYFGAVGIRCKPMVRRRVHRLAQPDPPLAGRLERRRSMDGAASSMYGHGGNDVSNAFAATLHTFEPQRGFGSSSNTSIPELDRMIEEQKRELDPDKRIAMIRKIAEIKHDQVLAGVTTYRPLVTIAWRDNVRFVPWATPNTWRSMQEIGFIK